MKKLALNILGVLFLSNLVYAGPADRATVIVNKPQQIKSSTVIENTKIKNKSEVTGSRITNVGIDQKNAINSIKIRKGVNVKNSKIENKAKMSGSRVTNVGIGQDNQIGSIDIGDEATPRANGGYVEHYRNR